MNWLRLHHEARTDKKLDALTDAQFRVWFNLLCFSGEQAERGTIAFDDIDVLAVEVARGDVELLEGTIQRCVKLKMMTRDSGSIAFTSFEKRQYDKPSDAPERVAERVRKHRELKRNADVTPRNAIDTETDTKPETEPEAKRVSVITHTAKPARTPEPTSKYDKLMPLFEAYCRGVKINPNSAEMEKRRHLGYSELEPVMDLITPEKMERLAAWVLADWQAGGITKTPGVGRVLEHESEFDRVGGQPSIPRGDRPNSRAPTRLDQSRNTLSELEALARGEKR